jgi:hypothetical protein
MIMPHSFLFLAGLGVFGWWVFNQFWTTLNDIPMDKPTPVIRNTIPYGKTANLFELIMSKKKQAEPTQVVAIDEPAVVKKEQTPKKEINTTDYDSFLENPDLFKSELKED